MISSGSRAFSFWDIERFAPALHATICVAFRETGRPLSIASRSDFQPADASRRRESDACCREACHAGCLIRFGNRADSIFLLFGSPITFGEVQWKQKLTICHQYTICFMFVLANSTSPISCRVKPGIENMPLAIESAPLPQPIHWSPSIAHAGFNAQDFRVCRSQGQRTAPIVKASPDHTRRNRCK